MSFLEEAQILPILTARKKLLIFIFFLVTQDPGSGSIFLPIHKILPIEKDTLSIEKCSLYMGLSMLKLRVSRHHRMRSSNKVT